MKKQNFGKRNFDLLVIVTFLTGVLLIISSYAWFYASLDVKVDFLTLETSSETGLFISLDGIEFGSTVEISEETLINQLRKTYPGNLSQWASRGLFSMSSNGISNNNTDKFDMFTSIKYDFKENDSSGKRYLTVIKTEEEKINSMNHFIAFDIFLKNVSGSPKSDNLYLVKGTGVNYMNPEIDDYDGTINSIRIGLVKIGSVPLKSHINTIQTIKCFNNCHSLIYETNSTIHSEGSIERAKEFGVNLVDGVYTPTYSLIKEGRYLDPATGQAGSGVELDTEHFIKQNTITSFENPIFQIPNAITKVRVYVWLEGQDMDNLSTSARGEKVSININFYKDLAGYY